MKISIIIVNYNVQYFLEQALKSTEKALNGIDGEIFVVDNNSSDNSCQLVKNNFPNVHLICNQNNVGFAKANNQAIQLAKGQYILLLNPDTVLQEDTLAQTIDFMDNNPSAGGLGVRMIDGTGKFLPESKRGFPSPRASFFKLSGLYSLFKKSKFFNEYYLGHLSEFDTNEVDVLAGAYMLLRKKTIDEVGDLDETFFMYGEDIDLSYRIQKGGYKNYYFAETQIIHYKGESTKRDSIKYVKVFYKAMMIFANKHFSKAQANFFIFILHVAIYLKAGIALIRKTFKKIALPLFEGVIIYTLLILLKDFWAGYYFHQADYYPKTFEKINAPLYVILWLLSIFFSGGYDNPFNIRRLIRGVLLGSLMIAAVYGFLPLDLRTSRAILVLGTIAAVVATVLIRISIFFLRHRSFRIGKELAKNLIFVGSEKEADRANHLLLKAGVQKNTIGVVSPKTNYDSQIYLAPISDLDKVVRIYEINEIVFCAKDIASTEIIHWMSELGPDIHYKIIPKDSMSIIGSNSKNKPGELYTVEIEFAITNITNKRNKRMFDIITAIGFLLISPLMFLISKKKKNLLSNILSVLVGKKTWVGYFPVESPTYHYPNIPEGILPPISLGRAITTDKMTQNRLNFLYAKNYHLLQDIEILFNRIREIGG